MIMSHRFHPIGVRWLRTAAALAMALLLVSITVRLWSPSARPALTGTGNGESWSVLDELPSNLFLLNEALAVELATEGAGPYELAAAVLEADRPCEWYDLPVPGSTESTIEELDLSGASRRSPCIEINQDNNKRPQKRNLSKKVS
jgi:hypothetical protein